MGGGWVEADLRCNLSDDILMESDPHRLDSSTLLLFYSSTLLLFYSSTLLLFYP